MESSEEEEEEEGAAAAALTRRVGRRREETAAFRRVEGEREGRRWVGGVPIPMLIFAGAAAICWLVSLVSDHTLDNVC